MTILKSLEVAKGERSKKKKMAIGEELYTNNKYFREYVDLCYGGEEAFVTKLPKPPLTPFKPGMAPSSLERVLGRFTQAAYKMRDEERRNHLLMMISENIADLELDFLNQLLKGSIRIYPKEMYTTNANL